ncbi:hypothetical protein [Egbenema bharatensis]|uniref:hypothetical protein n=1 Tax=Egbenema bharatensis TaxID=3463334 RepID=UPI003A8B7EE0
MAFFRQYIAPFLIVLVFLVALLAVSARIFLPSDMAMPAPIEEVEPAPQAEIPSGSEPIGAAPSLEVLVNGFPDEPIEGTHL